MDDEFTRGLAIRWNHGMKFNFVDEHDYTGFLNLQHPDNPELWTILWDDDYCDEGGVYYDQNELEIIYVEEETA